MILLRNALIAATIGLVACSHGALASPPSQSNIRVQLIETGPQPAAGTRFAIQFNDEPAIVPVADGRGGH